LKRDASMRRVDIECGGSERGPGRAHLLLEMLRKRTEGGNVSRRGRGVRLATGAEKHGVNLRGRSSSDTLPWAESGESVQGGTR
jgi:hypothetical protein